MRQKKWTFYQQMSRVLLFPLAVLFVASLGAGVPKAQAAGLLIADGGFGGRLEIKEHDVKVTINNTIAVTEVTQVFHNTENRQVEALYTFPVPKNGSVANFSMWINGKEVIGEVLEKERAREIYNSYKQKRRDPGLLEQVDFKRFEMRIFPIGANADQRVQIAYYQELDVDHDMVSYVYPLATVTKGRQDSRTTGRFSFQLEVKSPIPVVDIKSPSHDADLVFVDHSESYKLASLEQKAGSLAEDIVVHYDLKRPRSGIDALTSRTDGDGFFYLTITAGDELKKHDLGMDYVFLLDISGSMANSDKLAISNRSLNAFINELGEQDRFELLTFNVQPNTLFDELRSADEAAKQGATAFINSQSAKGGTILAPALNTAYRYGDPDRPLNVVLLSDGMTEQKERQKLIELINQRPAHATVFCIGIGNEINRPLLEQMAEDSGGLAAFVSGGDDFSRQAKAFRRKLMRPAVADIELDFGGVEVYDVVPLNLPNLYHGSPVRVYGRYRGTGDTDITLIGTVQGRKVEQSITVPFPKRDEANPEIERMWAQKLVKQLLRDGDRRGDRASVIDEVVRLGEDFSIVSEYTSFLVLENDAEYQRWKIERRNLDRLSRDRKAQAQRQEILDSLRSKALQNLGPQPAAVPLKQQVATQPSNQTIAQSTPPQPQNRTGAQRNQSRDFDIGFGSGPVGPIFACFAFWMSRRKKRQDR